MKVLGAIIAGGQSRRLGGNEKAFLDMAGRRMIDIVIETMTPQVERLSINANGDPARFSELGLKILADDPANRDGPLSGLATMLTDAATHPSITHLATVPSDCPFLPTDLVARLAGALDGNNDIAIASSRGRSHPVIGLWPVTFAGDLRNHLKTAEKLSVLGYLDTMKWRSVAFHTSGPDGPDPFFNVNTPEDLELARQFLSAA